MHIIKTVSIIVMIALCQAILLAQPEHAHILDRTYFELADSLPPNLTAEKSIGVLIAATRDEGEKMADIAQPVFAKSGVDVVAYYHVDDLFAGEILSKALVNTFIKREISQLVFLIKKPDGYGVLITPFSKDKDFVKHGQKAWQMESLHFSDMLDQLYRMSISLERKNFLISETPEFIMFGHQIAGYRYQVFKADLKSEKMAVLLEQPVRFPEEFQSKPGYDKVEKAVISHNQRIAKKNEQIRNVFANYPYPHVFIEEALTEKQLRNKNYNYILNSLHTTSKIIRNMLKYEDKQGVTDYIVVRMDKEKSEIIRINGEVPVYKYYVRNIGGNSYYLGNKWDVDYTWEASLNNHIQALIMEIR